MGSTNKTSNYDLSQFIGSDKPDWLTDYNDDMQKIDTALHDNSEKAGTSKVAIEALQSQMVEVQKDINDNMGDIASLQADVAQNTNNIDTIHHETSANITAINNINNQLTGYGRTRQKWIFIGASYGLGSDGTTNTGIFFTTVNALRLTPAQYVIKAIGGTGFVASVAGNTFLSMLKSIVIENPQDVVGIVVASLGNDVNVEANAYNQAVQEFMVYANANYINAKVYLALCSNRALASARYKMLDFWDNVVKNTKNFGAIPLIGSEAWGYRKEFFANDNIHLNDNGYAYIGACLASAIQAGYYEDANVTKYTENNLSPAENMTITTAFMVIDRKSTWINAMVRFTASCNQEISTAGTYQTGTPVGFINVGVNVGVYCSNEPDMSQVIGELYVGNTTYTNCNVWIKDNGQFTFMIPGKGGTKIPANTAFTFRGKSVIHL